MQRVKAASSNPNLLVTAFEGPGGEKTLVLLNRTSREQKAKVNWKGAAFRYLETASPQKENEVEQAPGQASANLEIPVAPGAIVTLTNVELGKVTEDMTRA